VVFGLGLEVLMGRRRRLRKSDGGELEINRQDLVASDEAILLPTVAISDEAILLPYVGGGDEASAEPHVAALDAVIVQQNIVASDAAIVQQNVAALDAGGAQQNVAALDARSVVASNEEIGEHNYALSQLKHKDNIGIYYFRICGH
jgi:hypothetical protein